MRVWSPLPSICFRKASYWFVARYAGAFKRCFCFLGCTFLTVVLMQCLSVFFNALIGVTYSVDKSLPISSMLSVGLIKSLVTRVLYPYLYVCLSDLTTGIYIDFDVTSLFFFFSAV